MPDEFIAIPADFDWLTYVAINPDLEKAGINSRKKALDHWNSTGRVEGRIYKLPDPRTFDWNSYLYLNPDLKDAGVTSERDACLHWALSGEAEGRPHLPSDPFTLGRYLEHRAASSENYRLFGIRASRSAPRRINVLLDTPCNEIGGSDAPLAAADRLREAGYPVRILSCAPYRNLSRIQKLLGESPAWKGLAASADFQALREDPEVKSHPDDIFISGSCWTAAAVKEGTREHPGIRSLFILSDFEPLFYPHSWEKILASYAGHLKIFSSSSLRDYMKDHYAGLFAVPLEMDPILFESPIPRYGIKERPRGKGEKKKLLLTAKPAAGRNSLRTAINGLGGAVQTGVLDPAEWDFDLLADWQTEDLFILPKGARVKRLKPRSLQELRALLPDYAAGLSVVLSPQPCPVSLEMAAAGLVTVVNTYLNRDAAFLKAISSNFVCVEAHPERITAGLAEAAGKAGDFQGKRAGAEIAWPRTWQDAWKPGGIERLLSWLRA